MCRRGNTHTTVTAVEGNIYTSFSLDLSDPRVCLLIFFLTLATENAPFFYLLDTLHKKTKRMKTTWIILFPKMFDCFSLHAVISL